MISIIIAVLFGWEGDVDGWLLLVAVPRTMTGSAPVLADMWHSKDSEDSKASEDSEDYGAES